MTLLIALSEGRGAGFGCDFARPATAIPSAIANARRPAIAISSFIFSRSAKERDRLSVRVGCQLFHELPTPLNAASEVVTTKASRAIRV
jgi:hypothetical protein